MLAQDVGQQVVARLQIVGPQDRHVGERQAAVAARHSAVRPAGGRRGA